MSHTNIENHIKILYNMIASGDLSDITLGDYLSNIPESKVGETNEMFYLRFVATFINKIDEKDRALAIEQFKKENPDFQSLLEYSDHDDDLPTWVQWLKSLLKYLIGYILSPSTKGDGHCFFHAIWGTNQNGIIKMEHAPTYRKELFAGFIDLLSKDNDDKWMVSMSTAREQYLSMVEQIVIGVKGGASASDINNCYHTNLSDKDIEDIKKSDASNIEKIACEKVGPLVEKAITSKFVQTDFSIFLVSLMREIDTQSHGKLSSSTPIYIQSGSGSHNKAHTSISTENKIPSPIFIYQSYNHYERQISLMPHKHLSLFSKMDGKDTPAITVSRDGG